MDRLIAIRDKILKCSMLFSLCDIHCIIFLLLESSNSCLPLGDMYINIVQMGKSVTDTSTTPLSMSLLICGLDYMSLPGEVKEMQTVQSFPIYCH